MEKFNFELFSLWNHPTCPIFSYLYPVIIKNNKGTQIYYRNFQTLNLFEKEVRAWNEQKKKKRKKEICSHISDLSFLWKRIISRARTFHPYSEKRRRKRAANFQTRFSRKKKLFNVFWLKFTREICLLSLRYSKDMVIYALSFLLSWNSLSRTFSKYIQISQVPRAFLSKQNFESKIRKIYGI